MPTRTILSRLAVVLTVALLAGSPPPAAAEGFGDPAVSRALDEAILERVRENGIEPAGPADDAEFVRRVYLDLLGRIPTAEEAGAFFADGTPDKRDRLIDALLVHPEFALHWRDLFDVWLNGRPRENQQGHKEWLEYLRDGLHANKGWGVVAREMLLPGIDPNTQAAAYFLGSRLRLPREEQLDGMTVAVAKAFFGVRMECAKCHDHPYVPEWKQDHYYGLGSFLTRAQLTSYRNKPALGERAEGEVKFSTTRREEKSARLMFLDDKVFAEPERGKDANANYLVVQGADGGRPAVPKFSRLRTLADYALVPANPYFRKAMVNRVWKQLTGRGLVEPVDQIHAANPPSHPKVMDLLAEDFAGHGFDLRRLIAVVMHSGTYSRGSRWSGDDLPPDNLYAVGRLRPLSPEQLLHSVVTATGNDDVARARVEREKARRKINEVTAEHVREEFRRDLERFVEVYHSEGDEFAATTAQALFMTYNDLPGKFLRPADGNLVDRLAKAKDDGALVRDLYLSVLSRPPAPDEAAEFAGYLSRNGSAAREQACRDLAWALLNSAEFRFNH